MFLTRGQAFFVFLLSLRTTKCLGISDLEKFAAFVRQLGLHDARWLLEMRECPGFGGSAVVASSDVWPN